MKLNENESIIGNCCILVPYCAKHVNKYNEWMQNEELLKATSSEPLTLEEEYVMQKTWRDDPDKLTFIILDKCAFGSSNCNEISSMAGDINAFFSQHMDEQDEIIFELSVMVAEQNFQRRGIAREACLLMMNYILRRINSNSNFIAKIGKDNNASINLFKNKLGFEEESFSDVFQLFTFKLKNCKALKMLEGEKELNIVGYY